MEIRPPTEQIDAPFFAAVRRRHPDVDIVVLPAEDESVAEPVAPDEVAATLERVTALVGGLWSAVAPDAGEQPEARFGFGFGAGPASVRAVARVFARRDDGFEVLVRLRHELESQGWAVRRPPGVGVERLAGVLDPSISLVPQQLRTGQVELTASYAEESTALLLTITSASMAVGVERATELTRGER